MKRIRSYEYVKRAKIKATNLKVCSGKRYAQCNLCGALRSSEQALQTHIKWEHGLEAL